MVCLWITHKIVYRTINLENVSWHVIFQARYFCCPVDLIVDLTKIIIDMHYVKISLMIKCILKRFDVKFSAHWKTIYSFTPYTPTSLITNDNVDVTSTSWGKVKVFVNDWWSLMSKYLCSNQLSINDVNWDQMNNTLR